LDSLLCSAAIQVESAKTAKTLMLVSVSYITCYNSFI
jgi:hypothetical protein